MTHVVVYWESEDSYSCVPAKKVDFGDVDSTEAVGIEFRIRWRDKFETGKIIATGNKLEMSKLEKDLAQQAADLSFNEMELEEAGGSTGISTRSQVNTQTNKETENTNVRKILKRRYDLSNSTVPNEEQLELSVEDASDNPNTDENLTQHSQNEDDEEAQGDNNLNDNICEDEGLIREDEIGKDNKIAALQFEIYNLRKQNKQLKRMIRTAPVSNMNDEQTDLVEIGPGLSLNRSLVELTKISYKTKPSFFIRKLLFEGGLFSLEEIGNSSMTGRASPLFPNVRRNVLDPIRFGAMKEFTIRTCGLLPGTVPYLEFINQLKNIPGDARKKLKKTVAGELSSGS